MRGEGRELGNGVFRLGSAAEPDAKPGAGRPMTLLQTPQQGLRVVRSGG